MGNIRLQNKLLRDVMARGVVTVPMEATAKQIVALLSKQGLSEAAVIGHEEEAMGVISDMDIFQIIPDICIKNGTACLIIITYY